MKTFRLVCLTLPLVLACLAVHAGSALDGQSRTGFFIQIMQPTVAPEFMTPAPTVMLGGVVFPAATVDHITYASSSGASGPCTIITNLHWRSEPIALLPGTNLLTVTAVQTGDEGLTASDELIVIHREPWRPPSWTNQPPVWTNHPPVCTNMPPCATNRPPVIITRPQFRWGTNNIYRYHLAAIDREGDELALQLQARGPVITTVTPLTNGHWMIHAMLTNYAPAIRFHATVSDGGPRAAIQRWGVVVPRQLKPQTQASLRRRR